MGRATPCHLPPPSLSLVGMPRWNSLNAVNKNPTRNRPLGTEQEETTPRLEMGRDLSTSFSSLRGGGYDQPRGAVVVTWSPCRKVKN